MTNSSEQLSLPFAKGLVDEDDRQLYTHSDFAHMFPIDHFMGTKANLQKNFDRIAHVTPGLAVSEYRRNPAARAIVERILEYCWRTDPTVEDSREEGESTFEVMLNERLEQIDFFAGIVEADRRALISGRSALILKIADDKDPWEPVEDLRPYGGFEAIEGIIPAWQTSLTPATGTPEGQVIFWQYDTEYGTMRIHRDRVVWWDHSASSASTSPIVNCYDSLYDLRKVGGASAEWIWKSARGGQFWKMNPEMTAAEMQDDKVGQVKGANANAKLMTMASSYNKGFSPVIATQLVDDVKILSGAVSSVDSHFMSQLKNIAMGSGIPLRILLGNEQGSLASDQDSRNMNQRMESRRKRAINPAIRKILERWKEWNVLPSTAEWAIRWKPLSEERTRDEADTAAVLHKMNLDNMMAGLPPLYTPNQILEASGHPPTDGGDDLQDMADVDLGPEPQNPNQENEDEQA